MARIREWLDAQRFEPDAFRCTTEDERVTCRLEFKIESEGIACAQAFGGEAIPLGDNTVQERIRSLARETALEPISRKVIGKEDPNQYARLFLADVERHGN